MVTFWGVVLLVVYHSPLVSPESDSGLIDGVQISSAILFSATKVTSTKQKLHINLRMSKIFCTFAADCDNE